MKSSGKRYLAIAVAVMVAGVLVVPQDAVAGTFEVTLDKQVIRDDPGTTHDLGTFPVPDDLVGQVCTVTSTGNNNESVHPGNDVAVTSANTVVLDGVEDSSNKTTIASGQLTLASTVSFVLTLGPGGTYSAELDVLFDCQPPPEEEIADPTWEVTPESLVCNPQTGNIESQNDGSITLNPFDHGSWDGQTSFTGLSAGSYGPFTATADDGYVFASTQTDTFSTGEITVDSVADDEPCGDVVTAVEPEIVQSAECEVEGTLTIPETGGVRYLLDGEEISAGVHSGPISGTLTAEAVDGYELANPDFSVEIDIAAAEDCPEQSTTIEPPTSTTEPEVGGSTTSTTQPETGETLPFTGISTDGLAAAAAVALAAGGGLVFLSRRSGESFED